MKVSVGENREVILEEVYLGVTLKTRDGEEMSICMRDSGFEFTYEGKLYYAQKGKIKEPLRSSRGNILVDQTPQVPMDKEGDGVH